MEGSEQPRPSKKWTAEEDARLQEAVKLFGTSDWIKVANCMKMYIRE